MFHKLTLLLCFVLLCSSMAYAGGDIFYLKVNQIQSISQYKHIIHFHLPDEVADNKHILKSCNMVKITVDYQYKESKIDRILLFLQSLLLGHSHEFNQGVKKLNQQITLLKQNTDKIYRSNDIEAFNYKPNNDCELFSKTLDVSIDDNKGHYLSFVVR